MRLPNSAHPTRPQKLLYSIQILFMINVDAPNSTEAPVTPEAPGSEIPKKFRAKHDAATKAVEAARIKVELARKALEIAKENKKEWYQLQLESQEAKLIEAEGALANIN